MESLGSGGCSRARLTPTSASRLGDTLGSGTARPSTTSRRERFADYEAFDQLRVEPFYRTVSGVARSWRRPSRPLTTRMEATHVCLVHGDYSPKNVLVGDGLWVIDFEVAHFGDPAFDLAFCSTICCSS